MGGEWKWTIPCLPPSANSLYDIIYSRREVALKPTVRKWVNDAKMFIPRIELQSATSLIEIEVVVHFQLLYANGKIRRRDSMNFLKILIDTIARKAGFDDSRIRKGSWDSIDSADEKVEVRLRELP